MDLTLENALDSGWLVLFASKAKSVKILSAILPDFPWKFSTAIPFTSGHFPLIDSTVKREVDL